MAANAFRFCMVQTLRDTVTAIAGRAKRSSFRNYNDSVG
jgi:hypothetical protein